MRKVAIGSMVAGRGRRLLDGTPSGKLERIRSSTSPAGDVLADDCLLHEPVEPIPDR